MCGNNTSDKFNRIFAQKWKRAEWWRQLQQQQIIVCVCSVYGKKREKNLCVRLEIAVVPFQMQNERMAYRKKKKK